MLSRQNLIWFLASLSCITACDLTRKADQDYHPGVARTTGLQFTPISVSPTSGSTAGGTLLTITGSKFPSEWRQILIGETACTSAQTVDENTVTCITAAHAAGTVSIRMEQSVTEAQTLTDSFTYATPLTSTGTMVVSSVVPSTGAVAGGTAVVVYGSGFESGATVSFGGSSCASATVVDSRKITCVTSARSAGAVSITVTNSSGRYARLREGYVYLVGADPSAPSLTSLSPTTGPSTGGTSVTLTGTGFEAGATVDFDGSACANVNVLNATSATCTTTAHLPGLWEVSFTNPDGRESNLKPIFTYSGATPVSPSPTVTSLSPDHGTVAGGTLVTISGTGFEAGVAVSFGGSSCTSVSVASSTSLTCTTGARAAGPVDIVVTTTDGRAGSLAQGYLYESGVPAPSLASVLPATGPASGGTAIVLTGANFVSGATVTVGGSACTSVSVVSATSITCTTPAHAAGAVDIVVTNPDAETATVAFTYTSSTAAAPTVASLSPATGSQSGGTSVTIAGTGFVSGATVTVGGATCTSPNVVSATSLTCTTPAHAAGAVSVVVTNPDAQSGTLGAGFTYAIGAVAVTSVSPSAGALAGGTSVTITGTGFVTGATVTFAGAACTSPSVVSATSITCTTPAHAAGAVDIVVTNPDTGSGTLAGGYTYQAAPTISGVSPASGSTLGGTSITVSGTGFLTGATVTVGGATCTSPNVVSNTSITCTTPAHAAGVVDIVVTNSDAQTGTGTGAFTYAIGTVTVTSATPSAGALAGGTLITITGTGFLTGATVTLGGNTCTSPSVVSATSITCTLPAHAAGAVDIVVTNTDTGAGTLAGGYTYRAAPTISGVSPASGSTLGGTSITVSGTGFVTGATVTVGGATCTSPTVVSATSITCTTPAHAAGLAAVVVANPEGQAVSSADAFTFASASIALTSLLPSLGPIGGGTTITLTGTGFVSGATVTVGGTTCTSPTVVSATSITCVTSAHAASTVNVTVTNLDSGTSTLAGRFTYLGPPTVTGATPATGTTNGSTPITITGTGFMIGATVTVGGATCTLPNVESATSFTCVTPAHAAGAVDIVVTNPDAQTGTGTGAFTYVNPSFTSASPSRGALAGGTTLTLTGLRFTGMTFSARVGGTDCTAETVVNDTTATCVSPAHAEGVVDISISWSNAGTSSNATLSNAFTYAPAPTVSGVSPDVGNPSGGTLLTITGSGFLTGATVAMDGSACTSPTVVSATSLTCRTPAHVPAHVDVVVTNPDGQTRTFSSYTYSSTDVEFTSISPTSGPASGGTLVTITGSGLFPKSFSPEIGGIACTGATVVNDTTLTCTTGAHAAGLESLVSTFDGGDFAGMAFLADSFTYVAAPTVTNISPSSGPVAGGTTITITGTGFRAGVAVTVGGGACGGLTLLSSTSLTCSTPVGVAGSRDIVVTNLDGQTVNYSSGFIYYAPPVVTSVDPLSGSTVGGQSLGIYGTGFRAGATVTVGGTACGGYTLFSAFWIHCATPAHAEGLVGVTVTNTDSQTSTLSNAYTFVSPPLITGYSPQDANTLGGTTITLTGIGFQTGATVGIYDSNAATTAATGVTVNSATSLSFTAPAHAATGNVSIIVTNPDGQTHNILGLGYYATPTITAVSPVSGTTAGGTTLNLTGTDLVNGLGTLTIGGVACASATYSTTTATCVTPAHAAGAVTITYTFASGRSGSNSYTYVTPSPTVTGVAPTSGVTAGGETLTITGTSFVAPATVTVGGTTCTSPNVVSATSITCTTPSSIPDTVDVSVTTSGETITSSDAFTYAAPTNDAWADMSDSPLDARYFHGSTFTNRQLFIWGGIATTYTNTGALYDPIADTWTSLDGATGDIPSARAYPSTVWTGKEVIVWGGLSASGVYRDNGAKYDPVTNSWTKIPEVGDPGFDALTQTPPAARYAHSTVWTGKEMIVWGGKPVAALVNTGGRYDPQANTWTATSTGANVPSARQHAPAVWTGKYMAICHGDEGDADGVAGGALYNPENDTWITMSTSGAPTTRVGSAMVWTGGEIVLWGGAASGAHFADGYRFTPSESGGSWTTMSTTGALSARASPYAVWTGREVFFWGGHNGSYLTDGALYDPKHNLWLSITSSGAPVGRSSGAFAWTGTQFLVWSGFRGTATDTGGIYTPATAFDANAWRSVATTGAPSGVYDNGSVWTGKEMIIWGGTTSNPSSSGYKYDPIADSWSAMSEVSAPSARWGHTMQPTGRYLVVFGGQNGSTSLGSGGRYDFATDTWYPMSSTGEPDTRRAAESVWTGQYFIPWGGYRQESATYVTTSGRYDPQTNTWAAVAASAVAGRYNHTMVWTGSEVLIFGGGNTVAINSGGRYNPSTNTWASMNTTTGTTPWRVQRHTAVWIPTIMKMVIFGGYDHNGAFFSGGYAYDPATDTWASTHSPYAEDAPQGRYDHVAFWTGKVMLIWGGTAGGGVGYQTNGYKMDVEAGTFTALPTSGMPTGRAGMSAVWTGREMLIYGGAHASFQNDGARYTP